MKKIIIFTIVLTMASLVLYATPYNEIIKKAKEESKSVQNAELSYLNSKLTLEKSELKDEVQISVNANAQVSPDLNVNPTLTVVLPNDGSTTIKVSSPTSLKYDDTTIYSVSPSVDVMHTFDLTGYDKDIITNLSNSRSALSSEYTYQNTLLSFENSCISTLKSIVNLEKNIENQKYSIQKSEKNLNDKLTLGQITTSSIAYSQLVNQIELAKNTLKAYERQYEITKNQYKELTGLTWDGLTDLPEPDLTLNLISTGNTKVILASIDEEIARENINTKNASINPQAIKVNGGVSSSNSKNKIVESNTLTASAGATYSSGNWSLGSSISSTYNINDTSFNTPSVTISGSWSNKTTKRSDEIELMKLENNLISASNSAQDEYTSYLQSYNALQLEVLQYEFNVSQTNANSEYLKANLENVKALYEAGLATKSELEDAEFNVKLDSYTQTALVLDGLTLTNKIKMLNL